MITADLSGKRVLVTGGASGIGLAAVRLFAHCGARVALNHLPGDPQGPERIASLLAEGLQVVAAPGDVSVAGEAERMVEAAVALLGGLDVLINNAGISGTVEPIAFSDLDAMTEAFWARILATNLLGPFRCAHAAAPALKASRGAIVTTASVAAFGRRGSSVAYAASKGAVANLTRTLAQALGPEVRVNAVAPGLVRTPWTDPWPEERKRATVSTSMLQRMVEVEDVAGAMLYLATAPAVTGHVLVVDCGSQAS